MKTKISVFLAAVVVVLCSCGSTDDNEPKETTIPLISADGVINGQLSNYVSKGIDSIEVTKRRVILAKCKLATDGKIVMKLDFGNSVFSDENRIKNVPGLVVSDTTVRMAIVEYLNAYDAKGLNIGSIELSNLVFQKEGSLSAVGAEWGCLAYCDKPFTAKGTVIDVYDDGEGRVDTIVQTVNMNYVKGWNVQMMKTVSETKRSTGTTLYQTLTTTPSAELQWLFYAQDNYAQDNAAVRAMSGRARSFFSIR